MKNLIQKIACSLFLLGLAISANAQMQCTASFTPVISGNSVTFTNTSTSTSPNLFYYWSFGDNNASSAQSPTHTYSSPGYYMVCLSIGDSSQNCWDTYCDTVAVGNVSCYASFSYQAGSSNNPVYFFNSSVGGNVYSWNFGDATTSTQTNPQHTYANPGTYNVCLTITNTSTSCIDTFCNTVVVAPPTTCTASFTVPTTSGSTAYFASNSSGAFYYSWDFGDNSTSSLQHPSHTYNAPGIYMVCLTIWDSTQTCSDTYCDTVSVGSPACSAFFGYQGNTANSPVYFYNGSSGATNYSWDFGDATTSTQANPQHTYANPGTYNVCLIITNNNTACTDTFCAAVFINAQNTNCTASFTFTQMDSTVQFTNTSTGGSNYMWDFGDNTTSTQMNPSNAYGGPGFYIVCLTVWDSTCQASVCDTINIVPMSVNEISQISEISAYPNPFNDIVNISFELQQADDAEITVFDMLGNKVDVISTGKQAAGKSTIQWNASNISKGVYMLRITTSQGSAVKLLTRN